MGSTKVDLGNGANLGLSLDPEFATLTYGRRLGGKPAAWSWTIKGSCDNFLSAACHAKSTLNLSNIDLPHATLQLALQRDRLELGVTSKPLNLAVKTSGSWNDPRYRRRTPDASTTIATCAGQMATAWRGSPPTILKSSMAPSSAAKLALALITPTSLGRIPHGMSQQWPKCWQNH